MSDTTRPVPSAPPALPRKLAVTLAEDAAAIVLTVDGEIDIASVPLLRARVACALDGSAPQIVVDLGECSFIDSAGLQVLVALDRDTARQGRTLALRPGPAQVQRIFDISGMTGHFFPAAPAAAAVPADGAYVVSSPPSTGSSTPVT